MAEYRFRRTYPLRHTDTFGGTPFVHGGVLIALTEIALDAYDGEVGIAPHREQLRFQASSEIRYRAPLRWDDGAALAPYGRGAVVSLRCSEVRTGRLTFECEVAAASDGRAVAQMVHRYVYVNAQSGRPETPGDWPQIVEAIRAYEPVAPEVVGE